MSKFKEQLKKDLEIIMNTQEFAEEYELEGQIVPLILDEDEIQERKIKAAEGTYLGEILIFVDKQYLEGRPVESQRMSFDHKSYFVISCKDDGSMYEIVLGTNSAW